MLICLFQIRLLFVCGLLLSLTTATYHYRKYIKSPVVVLRQEIKEEKKEEEKLPVSVEPSKNVTTDLKETESKNKDNEKSPNNHEQDQVLRSVIFPEGPASHSLYTVKILPIGKSEEKDKSDEKERPSTGGSIGSYGLLALPNFHVALGGSGGFSGGAGGGLSGGLLISGSGAAGGGSGIHGQPTHHDGGHGAGVHGSGIVGAGGLLGGLGSSGAFGAHGQTTHNVEENIGTHGQTVHHGEGAHGAGGVFGGGIGITGGALGGLGIHEQPIHVVEEVHGQNNYHGGIGIHEGGIISTGGTHGGGILGNGGGVLGTGGGILGTGGVHGGDIHSTGGVHGGGIVGTGGVYGVGVLGTGGGYGGGVLGSGGAYGGSVLGSGAGGVHGGGLVGTGGVNGGGILGTGGVYGGGVLGSGAYGGSFLGSGGIHGGGTSGVHGGGAVVRPPGYISAVYGQPSYHDVGATGVPEQPAHHEGIGSVLGNLFGGLRPTGSHQKPVHHIATGNGNYVEGVSHYSTPHHRYGVADQYSSSWEYPLFNTHSQPNRVVFIAALPTFHTSLGLGSVFQETGHGGLAYTPWLLPQPFPTPVSGNHQGHKPGGVRQPEQTVAAQPEITQEAENPTTTGVNGETAESNIPKDTPQAETVIVGEFHKK